MEFSYKGEKNDSALVEVNDLDKLVVSESGTGYQRKYELELDGTGGEVKEVSASKGVQILDFWYDGLWNSGGLEFAMQMMLMLVLGHVLALSGPVDRILNRLTPLCDSTAKAVLYVTFFTVFVSLINWGLGLIFGAIFARKVGEFAQKNLIKINYGIVGAAGYSGLMVWHGGISGSALTKVSDPGHLASLTSNENVLAKLPDALPFTETVFSGMNVVVSIALLLMLPISMYLMGKKLKGEVPKLEKINREEELQGDLVGAEKIDFSMVFAKVIGVLLLALAFYKAYTHPGASEARFMVPNYINFTLLALVFLFHKSIHHILSATGLAIGGVSGILLQFPLYFGIMGIMKQSGMIGDVAVWFSENSNSFTYPIYTFFSSGLVNVFVPSGGGQWAVQGPIVVETAMTSGVPLSKSVMALAYGDQLTNMMQPFWALPLLGITGLKAKQILPYTLFLMLVGGLIFLVGLMVF